VPEPLTIVVDGDDAGAREPAATFDPDQATSGEAMVGPDQSWFGAVRMAWLQPVRSWWWR
jgi:hypothetical protein